MRDRIGGTRAQGIVMMGVAQGIWLPPLTDRYFGGWDGVAWFTWTITTLIFGWALAGMFDDVDFTPRTMETLEPDFRSGRHRHFR